MTHVTAETYRTGWLDRVLRRCGFRFIGEGSERVDRYEITRVEYAIKWALVTAGLNTGWHGSLIGFVHFHSIDMTIQTSPFSSERTRPRIRRAILPNRCRARDHALTIGDGSTS